MRDDNVPPMPEPLTGELVPANAVALAAKPPPNDGRLWPYDRDLAGRIAERVAEGVSIHEQRADDPLTIPPAMVILAWKKQHPEFGLLMRQAELTRADLLREQGLVIADTARGAPARLALMIAQRMKLADHLDPPTTGPAAAPGVAAEQPTAPQLTDEALASIAAVGVAVPTSG